ncbi:hypothetical protein FACS1894172_08360 [Spirochaetia bacterium]|nr:hypothetical protein FACS1894164_07960 [Spirochaetia bacterium]GHU32181.1 hypothetical protein FACS1894172_08360 [Spirochaetia bacterium]
MKVMEGLTVNEIGQRLGIHPKVAKMRLRKAGLKPVEYAGPTAIYALEVVNQITHVPARGRPSKSPDQDPK